MPRITTPRLRNKMTRKIIPVIVFLKTDTATRTLRQLFPTSITENPLATDHEAVDIQNQPHTSREYPPTSSSPDQLSNPEHRRPFPQYAQNLRDMKRSSCPFR